MWGENEYNLTLYFIDRHSDIIGMQDEINRSKVCNNKRIHTGLLNQYYKRITKVSFKTINVDLIIHEYKIKWSG